MIVNGRAITKDILAKVREEAQTLPRPVVVRAIVLQPQAATESYLAIKKKRAEEAGLTLEIVRLADDATEEDIISAIQAPGADSLLVQLPLPTSIDTPRVLETIPIQKDADVLSVVAHAFFDTGLEEALLPPVVAAVEEILVRSNIDPKGKKAVVVGKGWLVGAPVATWLKHKGAQVTVVTRESEDFSALKNADIIVSGAGQGSIIRPEHLSPGVVLIDAGTSESGGAIVGDADPLCAEIASVFTPVPGGVGPIAVACLFKNALILAKRGSLQTP